MEAESLSIFSLMINATLLVQSVMLILLVASVISWVFIVQKYRDIKTASALMATFEERFWSGIDLTQLYAQVNKAPNSDSGLESIFRAGFKEFAKLSQSGADPEATMEGTQRAMRVALTREQEKLEKHLSFLATVGSSSPYIGLFGTVWGIMNSFRALANVSQATLAIVAPGIAEALIATAMGLFAAIPAVIAYNRYAAITDQLLTNYDIFADEFSSILHRQAHA